MMIYVNLKQIEDNPFQRRSVYDAIDELAADIQRHQAVRPDTMGLQQVPNGRLLFRNAAEPDGRVILPESKWLDNEGRLVDDTALVVQLEFGHRRKRAFDLLAAENETYQYMPVFVRFLDDEALLNGVWSENRQRRDLSAVEEAELLRLKLEATGGTQQDVAKHWGLARSTVANRLRLLQLPEEIQNANRAGQLSERQCLAMAELVRLDEMVRDMPDWQPYWPDRPQETIKKVLENPTTFTSDYIRHSAGEIVKYAGKTLPDCIARNKFDEISTGIEQMQCKGCPFRTDQKCLNPDCLETKLALWPRYAIDAFAAQSGIPASDRAQDFPTDDDERMKIKKLYDAGETANMVCAWLVGKSAARLTNYQHVSTHWWMYDDAGDGLAGIALGYRGDLALVNTPGDDEDDEPQYEMPPAADLAAWHNEVTAILGKIDRELHTAVADQLTREVSDWRLIQSLLLPAGSDEVDDPDELAGLLAKALIKAGAGIKGWYPSFYEQLMHVHKFYGRAGLARDYGDVAFLRRQAVIVLNSWYGHVNKSYYWEEDARDLRRALVAWLVDPLSLDGSLADLRTAIQRAKLHMDGRLAEADKED